MSNVIVNILIVGLERVSWGNFMIYVSSALIVFNLAVFIYYRISAHLKNNEADLIRDKKFIL